MVGIRIKDYLDNPKVLNKKNKYGFSKYIYSNDSEDLGKFLPPMESFLNFYIDNADKFAINVDLDYFNFECCEYAHCYEIKLVFRYEVSRSFRSGEVEINEESRSTVQVVVLDDGNVTPFKYMVNYGVVYKSEEEVKKKLLDNYLIYKIKK